MVRRAVKLVEADPFEAALKEYPDTALLCRDAGHHWKSVTARKNPDGTIRRTMACTTCESHRYQILDREGFVLSSSYAYEAGYIVKGLKWTGAHKAKARLVNIARFDG